jgi:Flp pilus assembly protein TadG
MTGLSMTRPVKRLPTRLRARRNNGQSLVEFAIVMPLFLLLLMVLFDFGRVVYAQNAITQDARAATRFASVSAPQSDSAIRQRARFMAPGVDYPDSAITGEGGNFYPDGTAEGSRVVVQITVQVHLVTPIVSNIVGGSFTVSATSEDLVRS